MTCLKNSIINHAFSIILSVALVMQPVVVEAQTMVSVVKGLPVPGTMVTLSLAFNPAVIKGVTLHPEDPFLFDFLIHPGDENLQGEEFDQESMKLIKYFMAALTVPEDEMWVNLSPYEKDRIIPDSFGDTEMGRDLLAQDYMLKQLTSSLMNPQDKLGRDFWKRVYQRAQEEYGTTQIPVGTFNKVWIVPDKAVVHENGASVFVVENYLKVMLEEDYLAISHQSSEIDKVAERRKLKGDSLSNEIIRSIIIPEIEREVNAGETFANLRQIAYSSILATWYKENIHQGMLRQIYVDQNKTKGIDNEDKDINQKIYNQYVESFKKGVFDFIKEDYDNLTQEMIPRKYFSGGYKNKYPLEETDEGFDRAALSEGLESSRHVLVELQLENEGVEIESLNSVGVMPVDGSGDGAMLSDIVKEDLLHLSHYLSGIDVLSSPLKLAKYVDDFERTKKLSTEKSLVVDIDDQGKPFIVGELNRAIVDDLKLRFVSVSALVKTHDGESYVMVRRPEWKREAKYLAIPGGYAQGGLSIGESALREIKEEIGLESLQGEIKLRSVVMVDGANPELAYFFEHSLTEAESVKVGELIKEEKLKMSSVTSDAYIKDRASRRESGDASVDSFSVHLVPVGEIENDGVLLTEPFIGAEEEKVLFSKPVRIFQGEEPEVSLLKDSVLTANISFSNKMTKDSKNIIFIDADNTIWKGYRNYLRLFAEILYRAKNGIPLDVDLSLEDVVLQEYIDEVESQLDLLDAEKIPQMLTKLGVDAVNSREEYERYFEDKFDLEEVSLVDGISGFFERIERLRSEGFDIDLVLLSNSTQFQVMAKAGHLQFNGNPISDLFNKIVAVPWNFEELGIDGNTFKSKQILNHVTEVVKDNEKPLFIASIGDKVGDMDAGELARFNGIKILPVGVTTGSTTSEELKEGGAKIIVDSLQDFKIETVNNRMLLTRKIIFSGQGTIVARNNSTEFSGHSKIYTPLLTSPWDPKHFQTKREIVRVGSVESRGEFSLNLGAQLQHLPIKFPNTPIILPNELIRFYEGVRKMYEHASQMVPDLNSYYFSLSVYESDIEEGETQFVDPYVHADGMQQDPDQRTNPNFSYLVSDILPTVLYEQEFTVEETMRRVKSYMDRGQKLVPPDAYDDLNRQANEEDAIIAEEYGIYFVHPYQMHKAQVAQSKVRKVFLRGTFSLKPFNRPGVSVSPFFDFDESRFLEKREVWGDLGGPDSSMLGENIMTHTPGGIDLNPNMVDLETRGSKERFDFQWKHTSGMITDIEGLTPFIIKVVPVTNIPALIGMKEEEEIDQLSFVYDSD